MNGYHNALTKIVANQFPKILVIAVTFILFACCQIAESLTVVTNGLFDILLQVIILCLKEILLKIIIEVVLSSL